MNATERDLTLRLFQQLHQSDGYEWRRVSGSMFCSSCGFQYRYHPLDTEHPGWNGESYDYRLCNGDVVHL